MERRQADQFADFLATLKAYYAAHGRHDLPWRLTDDPYKILVSEIMLQQTQVPRVIPKYELFLRQFPTVAALATAPLGTVLIAWQGLGYNRRAKFLWQAAQQVVSDLGGTLPNNQAALESLPGIGANTAGAMRAYAFNEPVVFVETNIRTVYIHHFFKDQARVPDTAIRTLIEKSLDRTHPRVFYWSLMDYGTYLKQTIGNAARSSTAYAKQPRFVGSPRQIRGRILRLLASDSRTEAALIAELHDARATTILADLTAEGLIQKANDYYRLP